MGVGRLHAVFGTGQVGSARHESRATALSIRVQNLMLPPLRALAKIFGMRPHYDHWDSRT